MSTYAEAVTAHYTRNWRTPVTIERLAAGPLGELPEDFGVLVIPRSEEMLAFATRSMSLPSDEERLELHMFASPETRSKRQIVEVLTAVAHYHRTGRRLGLGHTVNFGMSLTPGSACTRGLISLPYLDGPDLEWLDVPKIRFLWLIPVTESEVRFATNNGLEALEEEFERSGVDYLDFARDPVV